MFTYYFQLRSLYVGIFTYILRKPQRLSIRRMLEQSEPQQTKFTPMAFLKYQAKSFRRLTDYADIEIEHVTQLSDILDDNTVSHADCFRRRSPKV